MDWTGGYVVPASTVLIQSMVSEGDTILYLIFRHLIQSYPGAYAPPLSSTSTIALPRPDYSNYPPIGQTPDRRDIDSGGEGEEEVGYNLGFTNNPHKLGSTNNPSSV